MAETLTRAPASTAQTQNGAEIVLRALVDQGVEVVFGYPGGAVLPLYDAIFRQNAIRHILVRHEQAAVHAAEGYARSTGKVGCVLVTSGPGATNTVTGLTDALMDSVPVVCLTGQVPTHMIGNDAFQEADTVGITRPCTKHNYLVKEPEALARVMHEAFHVARSGRPGPVVVDLPKDILNAVCPYVAPEEVRHRAYVRKRVPDAAKIAEAVDLMLRAEKPLFYVGGGVINAGTRACDKLTAFVRETGFPITLTLMGLGAFPGSDPQFLRMLGMHGSLEANMAMHGCDVMINLGARFDDRVTARLDGFSPASKKIHADVDASSINKNVMVDVGIVGDAEDVIDALRAAWRERAAEHDPERLAPWWRQIDAWRSADSFAYRQESDPASIIKPQHAVKRLYDLTKGRDTYITTEVGQHQMWAAQFYGFEKPYRWMTSGGLGTMGYGYPAAMGVQVAHPDALVIDVAGEASFMMNMQELSTMMQYRLPVKAFILNNSWMGMVRQWQELFHGNRTSESYMDSLPDFVKLAEAFGAVGLRASKLGELDDVIREMIETPNPVICDVVVDRTENVYPMIPAGAAHNEIRLAPQPGESGAITEKGMVLV